MFTCTTTTVITGWTLHGTCRSAIRTTDGATITAYGTTIIGIAVIRTTTAIGTITTATTTRGTTAITIRGTTITTTTRYTTHITGTVTTTTTTGATATIVRTDNAEARPAVYRLSLEVRLASTVAAVWHVHHRLLA